MDGMEMREDVRMDLVVRWWDRECRDTVDGLYLPVIIGWGVLQSWFIDGGSGISGGGARGNGEDSRGSDVGEGRNGDRWSCRKVRNHQGHGFMEHVHPMGDHRCVHECLQICGPKPVCYLVDLFVVVLPCILHGILVDLFDGKVGMGHHHMPSGAMDADGKVEGTVIGPFVGGSRGRRRG